MLNLHFRIKLFDLMVYLTSSTDLSEVSSILAGVLQHQSLLTKPVEI